MWLGIDIGTSAVKAVMVDGDGEVFAQTQAALSVHRPRPGWSEQHPDDWWSATQQSVIALPARGRAAVRAIGLSGQMHGATLLGADDRPLRPAILWNDSRAAAACAEMERREPASRRITGNAAMPGFTAPKLLWAARAEPDVFAATQSVLLPKDYVRLLMTGDKATDLSDASGTLWLDVAGRRWSSTMLAATQLDERHMPKLFEGTAFTGRLRPTVAGDWGMDAVPVAAGAGDNAAGAVGSGVIGGGAASLSLGTSGVLFVANDQFFAAPDSGAHSFCHALPGRWHQMAVLLSAASALDWAARTLRFGDVAQALEAAGGHPPFAGPELFLPYLSGERTPRNDPSARGAWVGLEHDSDPGRLILAVLEGVAFAFADGAAVLDQAGAAIDDIAVIGGGARSRLWGTVLAAALGRALDYRRDAAVGPAYGAGRLARIAGGAPVEAVATVPTLVHRVEPDPALIEPAARKHARFRALYPVLRDALR
ncbi:MAG: xylulokinase [Proteobacteria bacterium SG_bin6]|nr:MAG: xylulokinase [Proteobacteria bacterium SG_bin6]